MNTYISVTTHERLRDPLEFLFRLPTARTCDAKGFSNRSWYVLNQLNGSKFFGWERIEGSQGMLIIIYVIYSMALNANANTCTYKRIRASMHNFFGLILHVSMLIAVHHHMSINTFLFQMSFSSSLPEHCSGRTITIISSHVAK